MNIILHMILLFLLLQIYLYMPVGKKIIITLKLLLNQLVQKKVQKHTLVINVEKQKPKKLNQQAICTMKELLLPLRLVQKRE